MQLVSRDTEKVHAELQRSDVGRPGSLHGVGVDDDLWIPRLCRAYNIFDGL